MVFASNTVLSNPTRRLPWAEVHLVVAFVVAYPAQPVA
jgi:hypothetical protein